MTQLADSQQKQEVTTPALPKAHEVFHEKVIFKELGECSHEHPEVCQACDFLGIYHGYAECPWPNLSQK